MRIAVRVRPGARADLVGGRWDGPRGPALLVAVRARAVEGAANKAVVAALAAAFELPRSAVVIVAGERGRDKLVDLDGDAGVVGARFAALLG
ncbi:DUF167 domain-containing protein [Pseudonocardia lacus]|uniref:DUF167 domain-containing protein n=1 Tax=Pseudonocardia lacus TaxID=2835865 RepID=UPI001BDBCF93|nr:DUF167 domain-containing protein [Pseudonocardia lacus]